MLIMAAGHRHLDLASTAQATFYSCKPESTTCWIEHFRTSVDAGSVRYEGIVVGANSPQGIFLVHYDGSVLYYFARDVETYNKTLATFAIAELKPPD